ncbi:MAG: hypothetical protein ABR562_09345 [Thermoplasmatota archaeon]
MQQIVDQVLALPEGTRLLVLGPLIKDRKTEGERVFEGARRQGFVRVRVDGELYDLSEAPTLDRYKRHTIEVVVDRYVVRRAEAPEGAERDRLEAAHQHEEHEVRALGLRHVGRDGPDGVADGSGRLQEETDDGRDNTYDDKVPADVHGFTSGAGPRTASDPGPFQGKGTFLMHPEERRLSVLRVGNLRYGGERRVGGLGFEDGWDLR